MGCMHSAESVSAGVGRARVVLLGRRHSGKSRLLAALGKKDWGTTRLDTDKGNDRYTYRGTAIEKYTTNAVSESHLRQWLQAKVTDIGARNCTIWYLLDEGAVEAGDAARELARLCTYSELAGVPIWLLVNTKNVKAFTRYTNSPKLKNQDMLNVLRLPAAGEAAVQSRVTRFIRVTASAPLDRGAADSRGKAGSPDASFRSSPSSVLPNRIDQLADALRGGTASTVAA